MNAVILAGGLGTRLRPLTDNLPKPMLKIANVPTIDYTISHLINIGIKDFVFTLGYRASDIIDWVTNYKGISSHFSIESYPLGTLGGVKAMEDYLSDVFIVISGDAVENIDLQSMINKHFEADALLTMAVCEVDDTSQYGVVKLDGWGIVTDFWEKPLKGTVKSNLANTGVYIVDKKVLRGLYLDAKYDFANDLFESLIKKQKLAAFIHDGYWQDIGSLNTFYSTNFDLKNGGFYPPAPHHKREEVLSYLPQNREETLYSVNCIVDGTALNSIIGQGSRINYGGEVINSIVLDGVTVNNKHRNCIIGKDFIVPILVNEELRTKNEERRINYF